MVQTAPQNRDSRASTGHRPPRGGRAVAWAGAGLIAFAWMWALLALYTFAAWPPWARVAAAVFLLAATAVVMRRSAGRRRLVIILAMVMAIRLLWAINVPSNDRAWTPDQARLPHAVIENGLVTIENVRHATYRTDADYDVVWDERTYSLDAIRTVDFVVEPFAGWRGLAHTMLTFGFADGEHVAISAEIRKEQDEVFSALRGAFRHYELTYVVGDERDLIGLRTNVRKDPVYVFPIRATQEQVRDLFVSMVERANDLDEHPEFYNTFTNTCATSILRHVNELRTDTIWPGWRTFFPGYSDALAWDLDLIDFEGTLAAARQRFLINGRSAFAPGIDGRAWSRQIRSLDRHP
jgi:hypothetical protein